MRAALCSLLGLLFIASAVSADGSLMHRRTRGLIQAPATKEQPFGECPLLFFYFVECTNTDYSRQLEGIGPHSEPNC